MKENDDDDAFDFEERQREIDTEQKQWQQSAEKKLWKRGGRVSYNSRKEVCRYYMQGRCMMGALCSFLHQADTTKMPECLSYKRNGSCRNRATCPFKHTNQEERRICHAYQQSGFCEKGPRCPNRHVNINKPVCSQWACTDRCDEKETCSETHSHPTGWKLFHWQKKYFETKEEKWLVEQLEMLEMELDVKHKHNNFHRKHMNRSDRRYKPY